MPEQHAKETVIGPDASFTGDLHVDSKARILGKFDGSIHAKGHIEIAEHAECRANIETGTIDIDGSMDGNITAADKVQLNATAKVNGDLVAARLIVADGAAYSGHLSIGPEAVKDIAPHHTPAPPQPHTSDASDDSDEFDDEANDEEQAFAGVAEER